MIYFISACILSNVCFADIMPKRVEKPKAEKAEPIKTSVMTPADQKYFSEDSTRTQLAGQVPAHAMWYHWVYGWTLFFGTAFGVYSLIRHTE